MVLKICLGIIFFIFLFLLVPIRYHFTFERKGLAVTAEFFFGLFKKTVEIPKKKKETAAESEEETGNTSFAGRETAAAEKELPILPDKAKTEKASGEEAAEKGKTEKNKESAGQEKDGKKKHPPLWKQVRFAVHNGLAENIFKALAAILGHSMPRKWDFCGEFGTGDPMQTGMLAGMAKAFLPDATKNILWKYIEPSYKLKGKGQGRIIPFYAVYIILRLAVSTPARRFWRYRQGGIHDE